MSVMDGLLTAKSTLSGSHAGASQVGKMHRSIPSRENSMCEGAEVQKDYRIPGSVAAARAGQVCAVAGWWGRGTVEF